MQENFRYITYSQQLEVLTKNPYIKFNDIDKSKALNVIEKIGYNSIQKYINCFCCILSFEDIYKIYLFDLTLKSETLKLIGLIERHIKTVIGNAFISNHEFDGLCYLKFDNFAYSKKYKQFFEARIKRLNKKSNKDFWIILEKISLGDIIQLYSFMKSDDKQNISQIFGKTIDEFFKQLKLIKKIRNICAHFDELINQINYHDNNIPENKICKFYRILPSWIPDIDEWNSFIRSINKRLSKLSNLNVKNTILNKFKTLFQIAKK